MISLLYTHNVLTLTSINISKYEERDKDKKIITSYTYAPSYSNIVCTADEAINIINPIFKVSATKTVTSKLGAFQPAMNYKKEEVNTTGQCSGEFSRGHDRPLTHLPTQVFYPLLGSYKVLSWYGSLSLHHRSYARWQSKCRASVNTARCCFINTDD